MLHKTRHDLSEKTRKKTIQILQSHLISTIDLSLQVKQVHWNVKGMNFIALHELFDKIYHKLQEVADMLAERMTALGGSAYGGCRLLSTESEIEPFPDSVFKDKDCVVELCDRLAKLCKITRTSIVEVHDCKDVGSEDLLIEVSRDLDHNLWLLEAHLQG